MHETAVVQGLMRILKQTARANGVKRVVSVKLKIGRLRGLDSRQIRAGFEMFAEGTLAEGARLDIDEVEVEARCKACGTAFTVERYQFQCPACGSADADVTAGRELHIESFEAAKADD